MRTVLKYPGAKNRIADWIVAQMPQHKVYLELFSGSAAVLLNKPRCHIETINDIDGDIVNLFYLLRERPGELISRVEFTPFARDEYRHAFEYTSDPVERARRYLVKSWQGFGNSILYQNGFKSGQQGISPNPAKGWSELPSVIAEVTERLKGVQIENLPATEILRRYDTPDVLVYADPPYVPQSRKGYLYRHEMSESDHIRLLNALLEHPGPVMLSGYDNDMYNQMLVGWRKEYKNTTAECGKRRIEVLWMNFENMQQMSLTDIPGVMP